MKGTHPNSVAAAIANTKRFWSDPELRAKNIAGRQSQRFKETHSTAALHTEEARAKCLQAKRDSAAFQAARKQAGRLLQSPEIREKARKSLRESPLAAAATKSMREAMLASEKCRPGVKNHAARKWHLRSPSNVEYHFVNLLEFIRQNNHLFDPADIPVRASRGLGMIRPSDTRKKVAGTWKGWTWISYTEVFTNAGDDLLHRTIHETDD